MELKISERINRFRKNKNLTQEELANALGVSAQAVGRVSARAVGGAVGRNPISLIIPCHRVVGARGDLTGYAGGLDRKKKLLALEGRQV